MLALLLILPLIAPAPEPNGVVHVDVIVVNQYNQRTCETTDDGKTRYFYRTYWYDSFWTIHWFPPIGMVRVPVWCNRGWRRMEPLHRCDDGWAASLNGRTVIAPLVLYVVSDYDFEYRNRAWCAELK